MARWDAVQEQFVESPQKAVIEADAGSSDREPGPELVPQDDPDRFALRLQQSLSAFVGSPRQAVDEIPSPQEAQPSQETDAQIAPAGRRRLCCSMPTGPDRLFTVQRAVTPELLTAPLPDGPDNPDDAEAVALGL
ncbi:hypothetical protein [Streptomyces sp. NPDC058683]|uniref:hypothetical protein n=1 Tax=Streptomyces sp. NPDC058683 TaxID=3346597 RepID=UPI0036644A5F